MSRRTSSIVVTALVIGLLVGYVIGAGSGPVTGSASTSAAPTVGIPTGPGSRADGLPTVALSALPPEAVDTVGLIEAGGPFPFDQDGAMFENREGLLPDRPRDYYREYTVPTPGSDDRGARRIVTGREGEMYWTADHYDSFAWIAR
ncbi:MAG: ribonuclease domain-containing protein [Candidatus Limnocylindrales bacterium]